MRWAAVLIAALVVAVPASARREAAGNDWPLFGFTPARGNASDAATRITAATAAKLVRQQVAVGGTVDSSPIYLHDVRVRGGTHDVFFVTTTYGRTVAVDAANGRVLWTFTPPAYSSYAGSYRITNMSPAADASRTAIYAGAPDGRIRKLRVADGRVV